MKKFFIYSLTLIALASCGGSQSSLSEADNQSQDSIKPLVTNEFDNTKYKLPSPIELYLLIKNAGAVYNSDKLLDISLRSKYITSDSKAIAFGIYASDLAYCTVFEKQQEANSLFLTAKTMADELGITEGFDSEMLNRIDKNLYNSDSLYQITSDSYWDVCRSLEENGNSKILSRILLGAWIESLHLAINSITTFDNKSELILRITEQSYLLENLIDYLSSLAKDKSNDTLIEQLLDLQYSFDKLYDNPESVVITHDQFKEIAEKTQKFRNNLIN